jgi:NAD-dependent dihydropyrimidine dehydrogenase PreA subunit
LKIFGNPSKDSPVFVTSNFDLTVRRVSKHLRGLDCYLLVAPTKGINVWCAAEGGFFNAHSVISVIKTSKIGERVRHRTLILPQLSASGIDIKHVEKETGWRCKFGPVYAKDIPQYVQNNFKKTNAMRRVKFDLVDRLDAGIGSSLFFFLLIGLLLFIFKRAWFGEVIVLGTVLLFLMYALYPYIPGKSGYAKILSSEVFLLTVLLIGTLFGISEYIRGLFLGSMVIVALIGIDFGGVSPIYKSELDPLLDRLGVHRIGGVEFEGRAIVKKKVHLDKEKCTGCSMCYEVCPKGVYRVDEAERKSEMANPNECIVCRACVVQCPVEAISLH